MARSVQNPKQVFLEHIKKLITNLLIENKNYQNGYYTDLHGTAPTFRLIKDTQDRARYILEQIDRTEHLVLEPDLGSEELDWVRKMADLEDAAGCVPSAGVPRYKKRE